MLNSELGGEELGKLEDVLNEIRPFCESINGPSASGITVRPRKDLDRGAFLDVYKKVASTGGVWLTSGEFRIPLGMPEKQKLQARAGGLNNYGLYWESLTLSYWCK